jgi:hypothetical protein
MTGWPYSRSLFAFAVLLRRPAFSLCHPDRSGPTFSSAPNCGASGRVVEGSLCFLGNAALPAIQEFIANPNETLLILNRR